MNGELGQNTDRDELLSLNMTGSNPFLSMPDPNAPAVEYKKGYVMRKCCMDLNGKRSKYFWIYFSKMGHLEFSTESTEGLSGLKFSFGKLVFFS